MALPAHERRRFQRIAFTAQTLLEQGTQTWPTELIDISLKGLLLKTPANFTANSNHPFTATVALSDELSITLELTLSHHNEQALGFVCTHIDLDSITHLRRLLELNLGDPELLERELSALN